MGCSTRRLMYILCIFTFAHNERDDKERKHVHTQGALLGPSCDAQLLASYYQKSDKQLVPLRIVIPLILQTFKNCILCWWREGISKPYDLHYNARTRVPVQM